MFFGVFSLFLEFIIRAYLITLGLDQILATLLAIPCGIMFAFLTNVKFNFKIPKSRRNQALVYFVIVSCFSGFVQWLLKNILSFESLNYEWDRLIISGSIFIMAYIFHRKYSFRDFKKVGVAIYANGVENLQDIYTKIGQYSDFIHVDIVDSSFTSNPEAVKAYRMETIKALWWNREIHTHIMSKTPSRWLSEVVPYSDIVYIHWECDEDIKAVLGTIHKAGKKAGLALTMKTTLDDVKEWVAIADEPYMAARRLSDRFGQAI